MRSTFFVAGPIVLAVGVATVCRAAHPVAGHQVIVHEVAAPVVPEMTHAQPAIVPAHQPVPAAAAPVVASPNLLTLPPVIRHDVRDIRQDTTTLHQTRHDLRHDAAVTNTVRHDLVRDVAGNHLADAAHDLGQLRRDRTDVRQDRRDVAGDALDLHRDVQTLHNDLRGIH